MNPKSAMLDYLIEETDQALDQARKEHHAQLRLEQVGTVDYVSRGIARVRGLQGVRYEELLRFEGNRLGMAFNIGENELGVILLDESEKLRAGGEVLRTHRVLDVPVGKALIGRVIDAVGRPLDGRRAIELEERRGIEQPAPAILDRLPVTQPVQTGIKVIDALIPVGRGQRELILGDRQTGKTALAVDTILNQRGEDMICIYCAIGKQSSAVAKVIDDLRRYEAMDYTLVVSATEDEPPGLQFAAAYAAMSIAEFFMAGGRDVLVVFDDLTRHARAYRELSLLLRRPPGREAYPGDIFYIHSRLLERSTHLRKEFGGGSITALPIIETQAQNISAYIPTNLVSITDGQIYLNPDLFQKGIMPAVDVGKSVSRVGGKTQLKAYQEVAGDLRLAYSQFEELEAFARFGTRLDPETRKTLERGRRVREVLKQSQYDTLTAAQQIVPLWALNEGYFDEVELEEISGIERELYKATEEQLQGPAETIKSGEALKGEDIQQIRSAVERIFERHRKQGDKE